MTVFSVLRCYFFQFACDIFLATSDDFPPAFDVLAFSSVPPAQSPFALSLQFSCLLQRKPACDRAVESDADRVHRTLRMRQKKALLHQVIFVLCFMKNILIVANYLLTVLRANQVNRSINQ